MSPFPESPSIKRWTRLYRRLLRLHPRAYRDRFADEMTQVFRDQLREIQESGSSARFLAFSIGAAIDLLRSVIRERIDALRNPMKNKTPMNLWTRAWWSLGAGVPLAGLVLGLVTAVTLSLPPTFQSTTRVLVRYVVQAATGMDPSNAGPYVMQTESELLLSRQTLDRVSERLSLSERWSGEYLGIGNGALQPAEIAELLRDRIEVRQIRNTGVLEVRVSDRDREMAAEIANAVVATYLEIKAQSAPTAPQTASIIDLAEPGLKPVRPNIPLNLFLGLMAAGFVGLVASGTVWFLLRNASRRRLDPPPISPA
ncbi:MAG: YveK family protein [Limisphaerales bacterium]